MLCKIARHKRFLFRFEKEIDNARKKWYNDFRKEGDSMAIKLTKESLECYILTCLSIREMYAAEILKNVSKEVQIESSTLYSMLVDLEKEGKISKKHEVRNGVACEVCKIKRAGKKHLKAYLK